VDELLAAGDASPLQGRSGLRRAELHAARADILIGLAFSNLVMYFIMLTSAAVLHEHGRTGIQTADQAAAALAPFAGPFAFIVFAIGLIGSGLLAIPILAGSATYALKEFLGLQGNLASKPKYRPTFYLMLSAATVAGVLMNLAHLDTIRALFITAVINGLVAAPLLALIVLVGGDRRIMKGQVSGKLSLTLTWLTTALMGAAAIAMILTIVVGH
jgi:Mn2+/Fe2+ NRAMP family transporter